MGRYPPTRLKAAPVVQRRFTHEEFSMDIRRVDERYAEIGMELIHTEPELKYIADSEVTIVYLASEHEKRINGRAVMGQCERIPEKYKWAVPCDFTITIFEPNIERLTDKQLRILIFHELLHIGIEKDGYEENYSIRPHDIEDFRAIIESYGLEWSDYEQA